MPKIRVKNNITGEEAVMDWQGDEDPTAEDIRDHLNELSKQREQLHAKNKEREGGVFSRAFMASGEEHPFINAIVHPNAANILGAGIAAGTGLASSARENLLQLGKGEVDLAKWITRPKVDRTPAEAFKPLGSAIADIGEGGMGFAGDVGTVASAASGPKALLKFGVGALPFVGAHQLAQAGEQAVGIDPQSVGGRLASLGTSLAVGGAAASQMFPGPLPTKRSKVSPAPPPTAAQSAPTEIKPKTIDFEDVTGKPAKVAPTPVATTKKKLTPSQEIYIEGRKAGLDTTSVHQHIEGRYGKKSTKDLTASEAKELLGEIKSGKVAKVAAPVVPPVTPITTTMGTEIPPQPTIGAAPIETPKSSTPEQLPEVKEVPKTTAQKALDKIKEKKAPPEHKPGDFVMGKAGAYEVTDVAPDKVTYKVTDKTGRTSVSSMSPEEFSKLKKKGEDILKQAEDTLNKQKEEKKERVSTKGVITIDREERRRPFESAPASWIFPGGHDVDVATSHENVSFMQGKSPSTILDQGGVRVRGNGVEYGENATPDTIRRALQKAAQGNKEVYVDSPWKAKVYDVKDLEANDWSLIRTKPSRESTRGSINLSDFFKSEKKQIEEREEPQLREATTRVSYLREKYQRGEKLTPEEKEDFEKFKPTIMAVNRATDVIHRKIEGFKSWGSSDRFLGGNEWTKPIVNELQAADYNGIQWEAKVRQKLGDIRGRFLSAKDNAAVRDYLEGVQRDYTPEQKAQGEEYRQLLDEIWQFAQDRGAVTRGGKKVGYLKDYLTHIVKRESLPEQLFGMFKSHVSKVAEESPGGKGIYSKTAPVPGSPYVEPRKGTKKKLETNLDNIMSEYIHMMRIHIFDKPAVQAANQMVTRIPKELPTHRKTAEYYLKNWTNADVLDEGANLFKTLDRGLANVGAQSVLAFSQKLQILHLARAVAIGWPEMGSGEMLAGLRSISENPKAAFARARDAGLLPQNQQRLEFGQTEKGIPTIRKPWSQYQRLSNLFDVGNAAAKILVHEANIHKFRDLQKLPDWRLRAQQETRRIEGVGGRSSPIRVIDQPWFPETAAQFKRWLIKYGENFGSALINAVEHPSRENSARAMRYLIAPVILYETGKKTGLPLWHAGLNSFKWGGPTSQRIGTIFKKAGKGDTKGAWNELYKLLVPSAGRKEFFNPTEQSEKVVPINDYQASGGIALAP